jgi:hypothetical protein
MSYARLVLLAAAAVGLLAFPAAAQTIATMDGHYYKLVPLKRLPRYPSELVTVIPQGATANVPQASLSQNSSCRLLDYGTQWEGPDSKWVTACGPQ